MTNHYLSQFLFSEIVAFEAFVHDQNHVDVSFRSISDIKHVLEGQMLSRGDKIVEFGDDLTFVCFG